MSPPGRPVTSVSVLSVECAVGGEPGYEDLHALCRQLRDVPLPYGDQLVSDVLNRTETAMTQAHCFLATELMLKAQQQAQRLNFKA